MTSIERLIRTACKLRGEEIRLETRETLIALEKDGKVLVARTPAVVRGALRTIRDAEAKITEARKVIERHGLIAHSLYTTTEDPPYFLKTDHRRKRDTQASATVKERDRRLSEIDRAKHHWVVASLGVTGDAAKSLMHKVEIGLKGI